MSSHAVWNLQYGPRFLRLLTVLKPASVPQVEAVTVVTSCVPGSVSFQLCGRESSVTLHSCARWHPLVHTQSGDALLLIVNDKIQVPSMEYNLFGTRALEPPSQCANECQDTQEPCSSFLDGRLVARCIDTHNCRFHNSLLPSWCAPER